MKQQQQQQQHLLARLKINCIAISPESMEKPLWRRKSNTVSEKTARIEGAEGEGQEDGGMGRGNTHYRKIISYR